MIRWDMVYSSSEIYIHVLIVYKHTLIWFMYLLFFLLNTQPQMWIMIQLSINYVNYCHISSTFCSAKLFFLFLTTPIQHPVPATPHSTTLSIATPFPSLFLHISQSELEFHSSSPPSTPPAISESCLCFYSFLFVILTPAGQKLSELEEVTGLT